MRIELKHVDFFKPIFSQGKNFGNKVNTDKGDVKLWYDTDLEVVFMLYRGQLMMHKGEFSSDIKDPKIFDIDPSNYIPQAKPASMVSALADPTAATVRQSPKKKQAVIEAQGE